MRSPLSAPPTARVSYGALVGTVAVLYFAREVLIPLALATLFSFLLGPLVRRVERWRLRRAPAVLLIAAVFFGLFGLVAWLAVSQAMDLAGKLPGFQDNIQAKVDALRDQGGSLTAVATVLQNVERKASTASKKSVARAERIPSRPDGTEQSPMAVRIMEPPARAPTWLRGMVGPLLGPLTTMGLVVIFTVFILIQRENLRDRLLHIAGPDRLPQTTQAVDEASQRVSRYLLMQVAVNLTFGAAIAGGLLWIGVPNAALWGLLTAAFRFVPYIGVWLSATAPLLLSLAAFQSWWPVVETAALFALLEITTGNAVEPWLYGSSTGLSPVAVVVAASFWTWLWGGVGLLLSIPLTVCIVVLGRHVPKLEFLHTLLGDEPVIPVETRLYQRLLAQDEEEVSQLVDEYLAEYTVGEFYDGVLIPALNQAQLDARQGIVSEDRRAFIRQTIRTVIDDLRDRPSEALAGAAGTTDDEPLIRPDHGQAAKPMPVDLPVKILIVPVKTEEDELAGAMLAHLLTLASVGCELLSAKTLANEAVAAVAAKEVSVVCLSAVRPFAVMQTRYLAKRLRNEFPEVKILVGLWDTKHPAAGSRRNLQSAPVDWVVETLAEATAQACPLVHCQPSPAVSIPDEKTHSLV